MRRTNSVAGWLQAGLMVLAAGWTLQASSMQVKTTTPAPRVSAPPASRPSAPPAARPSTPPSGRVAAPPAARPSTPAVRPATPGGRAPATTRTPSVVTRRPGTSGSPAGAGRVRVGAPAGGAGRATRVERTPGRQTTYRGGRVAEVRRADTVVRRPAGGPRTVVARHGDRVVVVRGARQGYVQRSVAGRRLVQRTYFVNRVAYVRAYRPFMYHGMSLFFYAPAYYYPPAFYSWVLGPWGMPIEYSWAWLDAPWYGYYRPYFRPWAVYGGPSFWIADFVVASFLERAFHARAEAPAAVPEESLENSAAMSDQVKAMIETEVRNQLADEQAEAGELRAAEDLPPSLSDKRTHLFLADDMLEVETSSGGTCVIGEGDALQMNGALPRGETANVVVLASKSTSCPAGSRISVKVPELVEMHNSMREKIQMGLETLRTSQGQDKLPALPAGLSAEPIPTSFSGALEADADAGSAIEEETRQADQMEQELPSNPTVAEAGEPVPEPTRTAAPPAPGPVAGVRIGQTESEVVGMLGVPRKTSFLGGLKKAYEYDAGKVIFTDGNVSDVQVHANENAPAARASAAGPAKAAAGPTIALGLSESEVIAMLGPPLRVSFLGGLQKMYEYSGRKIVFNDGAVSEVR